MPLIRSSQEVYNYLKRKSGESGEPMSILLDRWMVKEMHDGKDAKGKGRSNRSKPNKARSRAEESKGIISQTADAFDRWFAEG